MKGAISRRNFIRGGAIAAAGAAAASMVGCASQDNAASYLPDTWDQEADIVVVGFGGAGIAAALTAAEEDLGEVLVLEAAPEGEEGGNTRASQQVVFCGTDHDGLVTYQRNLNGSYDDADENLDAWATMLLENIEWLEEQGCDMQPTDSYTPEYDEVEGCEYVQCYLCDGVIGQQTLWLALKDKFDSLGIQALYDARVTKLIHNPETKEVYGVATEDGRTIKARKGVLLSCGGFEKDVDLLASYYPIGSKGFQHYGTPYNRGDGIRMAQSVGAQLWHMNNYAGGSLSTIVDKEKLVSSPLTWGAKDYIFVGPNAKRWLYEETQSIQKHGKANYFGNYVQVHEPFPAYAVFGPKAFEAKQIVAPASYGWASQFGYAELSNQERVDEGFFFEADTIEELAEMIELDPAALKETIETYNGYCAAGKDPEFGRGEDFYSNHAMISAGAENTSTHLDGATPAIKAFELVPIEAPYYAFPIRRGGANTQGGPRRQDDCNVLSVEGEVIPRLYSAGELGSIYAYMYNGGGNVAEAIATGRTAARSIGGLEAWDAK